MYIFHSYLQASLRQTWLSDNMVIVSEDNFGTDVYATEAAFKKHETLEADVKVCIYMHIHVVASVLTICMQICTYVHTTICRD